MRVAFLGYLSLTLLGDCDADAIPMLRSLRNNPTVDKSFWLCFRLRWFFHDISPRMMQTGSDLPGHCFLWKQQGDLWEYVWECSTVHLAQASCLSVGPSEFLRTQAHLITFTF